MPYLGENVFKLNRKTEYALIALKFMHEKKGQKTTTREICDSFSTPFDTTAKVMQSLNTAGIVKSVQGVRGGYTLNKDLAEVNYFELVQIIEGHVSTIDCENGCCLSHSCNISGPVQKLNHHLMGFFKSLSLLELFESKSLELSHKELA